MNDFDFLSPQADLKVTKKIPQGSHSHKDYEVYDYPRHYRKNTGLGDKRAQVMMEAEAIRYQTWPAPPWSLSRRAASSTASMIFL